MMPDIVRGVTSDVSCQIEGQSATLTPQYLGSGHVPLIIKEVPSRGDAQVKETEEPRSRFAITRTLTKEVTRGAEVAQVHPPMGGRAQEL
jgi:hypothetical protein